MGVGIVTQLGSLLFGGGNNRLTETIEVFRPNAEASEARFHEMDTAALEQLSAEFARKPRGVFDAFVDGLNRLPRPVTVLVLLFLIGLPVFDPIWATEIYTALALVPEPIWVLSGVMFSFYFGGRMQIKDLDFTRSMAAAAAALPSTLHSIKAVRELDEHSPGVADTGTDAEAELASVGGSEVDADGDDDNPAIRAWKREQSNT